MRRQGSITVFLSLSMLCVFALLCVMVEQARTAGSRYYFQVAVNASLDTLFSQYHRELWKRYRILGLPYESELDVNRRLEAYVERYLEVENWYPMQLEYVDVENCRSLADQGGDFLVQEVLDYMQYGVWDSLELVPENGEQLWKDIKEAASAGTMNVAYDGQEREVRKLEAAVEKLFACVEQQEKHADTIRQALEADEPESFYEAAEEFCREAGKLDALLDTYEKRADQLKAALERTGGRMIAASRDFQEGREQLFKEQLNPYESYVEEDGRRYQQILQQAEATKQNLELLQETECLVEQLEAEAQAREEAVHKEAAQEEAAQGEAVQEQAGGSELSLAPAADLWAGFLSTGLQLRRQKGDEEKQGFLENVRDLAQESLMQLVLPEDMKVSDTVIHAAGLPSSEQNGGSREKRNVAQQVLVHEYCGEFFRQALDEDALDEGKTAESNGVLRYELEYLLQGGWSDRENLEKTIEQIFLVRQGLNLIHILSDSVKREEANGLAAAIAGVTGIAPLVEIMAGFIMVVWAMGESVMDLRRIMSGGRVPLWKDAGQWQLSLEGLLELGQGRSCSEVDSGGIEEAGLPYESYLKLLLLAEEKEQKQLRMLDVIQLNLQSGERGFSLSQCAYQVDICGKACGKHVFFSLPIVENFVRGDEGYPLDARGKKAY